MRTALLAPLLAAILGVGSAAADDVAAYRGFVADAKTGAVTIVDLVSGETLERMELQAPVRFYRGPSGRYVYAVQTAAGRVAVIDSGVAFDDHGDHADLQVTPPALLPVTLEGGEPVHFNTGGGTLAVFFDGDGTAGFWR
jgi:hypothetical protein